MKTRKDILRPIRKQVRSQCATFSAESNGHTNSCHFWPANQPHCVFFREDGQYRERLKAGKIRCKYFETHVLPADPALELAYWGKHPDGIDGQAVGICERCKDSFNRKSNRQEYCPSCREIRSKETARDRMRKKYWKDKTQNLTF